MNRDQLEGRWNEFNARVKQAWGDLTDDELTQAEGNVEEIAARIQKHHGDSKAEATRRLNEMKRDLDL